MSARSPRCALNIFGLCAVLFLAVALPLCLGLLPQDTLNASDACATASEGSAAVLAALGSAPRVALPTPWLPWIDTGNCIEGVAQAADLRAVAPHQVPLADHAPNESRRL